MSYDITAEENASIRADFDTLADALPGTRRLGFRGVVGGVEYDDPQLFETNARNLGYHGWGKRSPKWKVGTPVAVTMTDGTKVAGQVWSPHHVRNYVWLALDNGMYVKVYTPRPSEVVDVADRVVGKVAA